MSPTNENIESSLDSLFEGLRAGIDALQETRDQLNKEFALDFNPIGLFRPDENQMSRILAFLLNPRANHGQGHVFLECFCKTYCRDLVVNYTPQDFENAIANARVFTEYRLKDGRRIDILVKLGVQPPLWIGVENKIWAADQEMQLADYHQFLREASQENCRLLYLSPDGRKPSEGSMPKERWKELEKAGRVLCVSYVSASKDDDEPLSLCALVDEFMAKCAAEDVNRFLRLLQKYWKTKFLGEKAMDVSNFVAEYATRDDKLELAWKIIEQENKVKEAIWERVKKELMDWSKSEGVDLEICAQTYREMKRQWKNLIVFNLPTPNGWRLLFAFQHGNRSGLLSILSGRTLEDNDKLATVKSAVGYKYAHRDNVNIHEAFSPYAGNWECDIRPWRDMLERSSENDLSIFSNRFIDEYKRVAGILEQQFPA